MGETPAWQRASGALQLLAGVLSLAVPGVGQGFGGRPLRGVFVAIGFAIAGALAIAMFMSLPTVAGVILPLILAAGARIWAGIDAARVTRERGAMPWPPRLGAVTLVVLISYVLDTTGESLRARFVVGSFRSPSVSMEPTLLEGDYFVARPLPKPVPRGDVVMFAWPHDLPQTHVARVVGLSGDTIAMRAGRLMVNGRSVSEPYASHTPGAADSLSSDFEWQGPYAIPGVKAPGDYRASANTWGPLRVPSGMYFVLGDNRDYSLDSRYVGFVKESGVRGVPYRVYFSYDRYAGNVRWSRMGMMMHRPPA